MPCGRLALLLHDMSQLMGEQLSAGRGSRPVVSRAENNLRANGVGQSIYCMSGFVGAGVGMHAHFAEVVSEARLHDGPCRSVEWLAGRAQDFVDKGWRYGPAQVASADPLHLQELISMFFLTVRTRPAAGAFALELRLRHAHHLLGEAICLRFILVSRRVDPRFLPYRSCCWRMYGSPAKIVPEAR